MLMHRVTPKEGWPEWLDPDLANEWSEEMPLAWMPAEYVDEDGLGGPRVDDPLSIYVTVARGPEFDDADGVNFGVSLAEIVREMIEDSRSGDGVLDDTGGALRRIRNGLSDLLAELDAGLSK